MNIQAPEFDRLITVRDAYRAMDRFLAAHLSRGETSTVELIAYAGLAYDGMAGDPAALSDYLHALDEVQGDPPALSEIVTSARDAAAEPVELLLRTDPR